MLGSSLKAVSRAASSRKRRCSASYGGDGPEGKGCSHSCGTKDCCAIGCLPILSVTSRPGSWVKSRSISSCDWYRMTVFKLDCQQKPEFDDWRWVSYWYPVSNR